MRRNTDAIVPYDASEFTGADEEEMAHATDSDTESSVDFTDPSGDEEDIELLPGPRPSHVSMAEEDWDKIEAEDVQDDAWAKAFIWSDLESVVARFESVTIVTLQVLIEGKLLLTTHGKEDQIDYWWSRSLAVRDANLSLSSCLSQGFTSTRLGRKSARCRKSQQQTKIRVAVSIQRETIADGVSVG